MEGMGATTLVPVGEYLSHIYRPDQEYVDGQLVERNVGEYDHGRLQMMLAACLYAKERTWRIRVVTGCRVQVKKDRFRIPDVSVLRAGSSIEQIIETPPFLCIEVLSPEDRMAEMQGRIDDYLAMGVEHVWLIDPRTRRAWMTTSEGSREAKDGILRAGDLVQVPLAGLFD
jgi:Uma2 family endonuclease